MKPVFGWYLLIFFCFLSCKNDNDSKEINISELATSTDVLTNHLDSLKENNFQEAIHYVETLVNHPTFKANQYPLDFLIQLTHIQLDAFQNDQAKEQIEKIVSLYPTNNFPEVHNLKIRWLKNTQQYDRLIRYYEDLNLDSLLPSNILQFGLAFVEFNNQKLAGDLLRQYANKKGADTNSFTYLLAKGNYYSLINSYDSSTLTFEKAQEKINSRNSREQAILTISEGFWLTRFGYLQEAEEKVTSSLILAEQIKDYRLKYELISLLAEVKFNYTLIEEGVELLLECLNYYEQKNYYRHQLEILLDLAWIYSSQRMNNKALDYFDRANLLLSSYQFGPNLKARFYNYRGVFELNENRPKTAGNFFRKGIELYSSIQAGKKIEDLLFNQALVFESLGELDTAIVIQNKLIAKNLAHTNRLDKALSEQKLAKLYRKKGDPYKSLELLNQSESIFKEFNLIKYLKDVYEEKSYNYEQIGQLGVALSYKKKYLAAYESIYSESNLKKLTDLDASYQLQKSVKELELMDLKAQNYNQQLLLTEEKIQSQQLLIGFISFIVILLIVLIPFVWRVMAARKRAFMKMSILHAELKENAEEMAQQTEELKAANERIEELNEGLEKTIQDRTKKLEQALSDLDRFFYRAAHDFRGPLTTFLGLCKVGEMEVTDPLGKMLIEKFKTTTMGLDRMVQKLNAISIINAEDKLEPVDLKTVIEEEVNKIRLSNGAEIINSIELKLKISDPIKSKKCNLIGIVVRNLIENSVHFKIKSRKTKLFISLIQHQDLMHLTVSDNGKGIHESIAAKIFDMYYKGDLESRGNGLGLYLVKLIVEKLNGNIRFENNRDEGVSFFISINVTALEDTEITFI
ncbi:MAG: HAMP domain-containing histidine kinase [Cyclobacteriaceae bacterium]|nr:HAMP domain-containing histidine kinase [Cyclobacteriaceae bacterium]MCH8515901.1 HAMP domain-containing histidine kinase [Cyclobacteriaceae bacterium]